MLMDSTEEIGMTSSATGTRLIRAAFSINDDVPVLQASVKKLYGTSPHSTNAAKCGMRLLVMMCVNRNHSTPIMISGFRRDQKTPRDMLR